MNQESQLLRDRIRRVPLARAGRNASFTLLELLISLGIILILATLTMRLLNATLNSDRIRNGSRELQSFLAGARDRAIHAGQPRGVRLILDPLDRSTVRSFVYIGAPSTFTEGSQLTIDPFGNISFFTPNNSATVAPTPSPTSAVWTNLWNRGLLTDGTPIQLTVGTTTINAYLTVAATGMSAPGPTGFAIMTAPTGTFPIDNPLVPLGIGATYALQLGPTILPGDEPRSLPQGIVIDLDNSVLPASWTAPGGYSDKLDILFSPSGTVMGPVAASGRIHFVLSEYTDASVPIPNAAGSTTGVPLMDINSTWQPGTAYQPEQWVVPNPQNDLAFRCVAAGTSLGNISLTPLFTTAAPGQQFLEGPPPGTAGTPKWECYNPKTRLIVSLATRTGRVTTSPVSPSDRYRFAETGEVTQ
jgi:type II secretory pathway pseudopilin PulG